MASSYYNHSQSFVLDEDKTITETRRNVTIWILPTAHTYITYRIYVYYLPVALT